MAGYPCIRTPSLVVAKRTLLAFAECRNYTGDNCYPDDAGPPPGSSADRAARVCVRSRPLQPVSDDRLAPSASARAAADAGPWGPLCLLPTNGPSSQQRVVYDPKAGRLIVHYNQPAAPGGQTWQVASDDDGATWSAPLRLTGQLGPCGGFDGTDGDGVALPSGRLLMTAWSTASPRGAACVYASDDHGSTWRTTAYLGAPHHWIFETSLAATGGDTVYLNGRNRALLPGAGSAPHPRVTAWSHNGGETFANVSNSTVPTLDCDSNGVQQGITSSAARPGSVALLAPMGPPPHPADRFNPVNNTGRRHLVLHRSRNGARTWPPELAETVNTGYGGYSSLAVVEDAGSDADSGAGHLGAPPVLGLLYETGWPGCSASCSIAYTERAP